MTYPHQNPGGQRESDGPSAAGSGRHQSWHGADPTRVYPQVPVSPASSRAPEPVVWPEVARPDVGDTSRWLLADDYFRLCHHDRTGDLRVNAAIAGIGLASALIGAGFRLRRSSRDATAVGTNPRQWDLRTPLSLTR